MNGVCGDCSAYIGFLHASLACFYARSFGTEINLYNYVPLCTTMASNMRCTLRSKPGGCACGISLTSASTRVPRKGQSTRVVAGLGCPRKGQGAGPRKIYGKPTEGGILAPPPPQFQPARPNFFPSHLQHFHGAGHVKFLDAISYLLIYPAIQLILRS